VDERKFWGEGHRFVAGVDEVGRGAWAGPLTVGVAVVEGARRIPSGMRDSKALPEDRREALFDRVGAWCAAWAVGHVSPEDCDRLGMTAALRLATRRAFAALPADVRPDAVVLDGNFDYVSPVVEPTLFDEEPPVCTPIVRTVIGADARCASVAAASVLAKVSRDRIMRELSDSFPPFDFERNKGYPSPVHKRALCGYGMTAIHRRSWVFAEHLPWR
jgi:ribonuclease HII